MNRTQVFALALAAGLATSTLAAQTAAPAAAAPAVTPQAIPAKIAIFAYDQAVIATNEGQKTLADIQKKYEPQKAKIDSEASEVDSLKKQLQALPASTSDEERANRMKVIDTKEKSLQRDAEDAQNAYQGDVQEALGKIAQKVGATAAKYVQEHGYTLLLNVGGNQQVPNPILWFVPETDISQAVVNEYNAASGVAAPTPSAPAPQHRPAASTTPKK
jgi:Skp family chaperone for outer membrane proteins